MLWWAAAGACVLSAHSVPKQIGGGRSRWARAVGAHHALPPGAMGKADADAARGGSPQDVELYFTQIRTIIKQYRCVARRAGRARRACAWMACASSA